MDETPWLTDSTTDAGIEAQIEAVFAVLVKRRGLDGAKITWERREPDSEDRGAGGKP